MKHTFTINNSLIGLNKYSNAERTHRQMAAKIKKEVQEEIGWEIKTQLKDLRIEKKVTVHFKWIEKNRRRDKDNIAFAKKFILDALVEYGVLANDGWKEIEGFTDSFGVDKDNPRVEVIIEEVK